MSHDSRILSWLSAVEVTGPIDTTLYPAHCSHSLPAWHSGATTYYEQAYPRSTRDFLQSFPSQEILMKVAPHLPTNHLTPSVLEASFPHKVHSPLPSMFEAFSQGSHYMNVMASKYYSLLDLRECLRVEEIVLEMRMDMDPLHLDPTMYHAAEEGLKRVRGYIMRACESLSYIEEECARCRVLLDTLALNEHRIAHRPPEHPFYMIILHLKPGGLTEFNNFQAYGEQATSDTLSKGAEDSWPDSSDDGYSESSGSTNSTASTYTDTTAPTMHITTINPWTGPTLSSVLANLERSSCSSAESSHSEASDDEPTSKPTRSRRHPSIKLGSRYPLMYDHPPRRPSQTPIKRSHDHNIWNNYYTKPTLP